MKLAYKDDQHAYWIDGRRCKGVTSIAGIGDDTYALDQWKAREIARGFGIDDTLARAAKTFGNDRDVLQKTAEKALVVAKAHEAAEFGTRLHGYIEMHNRGIEYVQTEESIATVRAWDMLLDHAGLEVVPEFTERIVCYPTLLIAGRLDCVVRVKKTKKLAIVDLKTSKWKVKYPHKMSKQLATYANATQMAGELDGGIEGETEEFFDMPANLDRKTGYIVSIPSDGTEVGIFALDIAKGWKIVEKAIFPMLTFRKDKGLIKPVDAVPIVDPHLPADDESISLIRGRLKLIAMVGDHAKQLTRERWPVFVPTASTPEARWTVGHLDLLDSVLASVERDCEVPF